MNENTTQLAHFDRARQEIILATDIDEVKAIRDKAEALRAYAKQAGEGLEMQNMCAEIKLRAERRAGELLKEKNRRPGETDKAIRSHGATISAAEPKLEDLGINKSQSSRWQQIASLPEDKFEAYIVLTKAALKELTTTSMLRLSRDVREATSKSEVQNDPLSIDTRFNTIIIDPPWPIKKILREDRPHQDVFDYPTMTLDEIEAIPVIDIAADDCHLFLWATEKFLPASFVILESWGFKYILTMVWHKANGYQPYGLPKYNCEFVLYGRIGNPRFIDLKRFNCCFEGVQREHSRKPDEFYEMIRRVCQGPRLDYFSREEHEGFSQYGNETDRF